MSVTNDKDPRNDKGGADPNLAEDVLRQAGKSEEEVKRTGAMDRADDEVEGLFEAKHQTANSPAHKAVWNNSVKLDMFKPPLENAADEALESQKQALEVMARHLKAGTYYDAAGKVSAQVIQDLAGCGYWGMLIEKKFGGQGASVRSFMRFLTKIASTRCPTTAGLASVHGCIGAVDPIATFGNDEQKARLLPQLSSGRRISGFALTEPNAGSDLTALRSTAVLDGDAYVLNGEKLFITNAIHGRLVSVVCLIDGKPNVLVVELPETDTENFQVVNYGLHCLKKTHNNGLKFVNFRVPKENLLKVFNAAKNEWEAGRGLLIAYHGLNRGRVALAANASGVMRRILRSITPRSWGDFRKTYGEKIEKRELVKARVARAAALIVGADALVAWCSSLLDEGYRGELECIIAKIFGSSAQWEVATEIGLTTHGGRALLEGHLIGDGLHDFAAPRIYEGENQMLAMAFFKALAKEHGMGYMLPMGNSLFGLIKAVKKFQVLAIFTNLWGLMVGGLKYVGWQLTKRIPAFRGSVPGMDKRLKRHVSFAQKQLKQSPLVLDGAMMKHQLKLADRQGRIVILSQDVQDVLTMLVTCQYATQVGDEATVAAADVLCQQLRMKLTGERPSDNYFKACSKLADMVVEGRFTQLDGVPEERILRPYAEK